MPKKNRTIHFLSNFGEVNKRLIRKPFPILINKHGTARVRRIHFCNSPRFKYGLLRLDPDASRICTVIFPWGKYSYERLPMGIADSPDIFQSKMLELMEDLEYVRAYLDDLLCISRSSLEDHLKNLKRYSGAFAVQDWKSMRKNQHSAHLK